ncbi:MAG: fibrillarin-like rRNA/tRNA 2'-O-methyltransferase [Methanomicrobiales archaeon]|nr:fibrillarin-like rRNA/tRNA 2'-O-methyltransferase [Methanomicrobiales archaeon]
MSLLWQDGKLVSPGKILPGDIVHKGMRVWDPNRSKVAALCHVCMEPPLCGARVLYLGAAAGSTVSFISDYAEVVYAVEFSSRPVRNLVRLAQKRTNIIPFFCDARYPEQYMPFVELVDIMIQDISQRDQADIAIKNLPMLKKGGSLILFLKMLSMGVRTEKDVVIGTVRQMLEGVGICVTNVLDIERFHTGHVVIWGIFEAKNE